MLKSFLALTILISTVAPAYAQEPLRILARDFEPFFYRDGETITGLEYDILEYFARATGRTLEIEFVEEFADLIPGIESDKGDIASGTMTITEARAERIDFSASYFPVRIMVVEPDSRESASHSDLSGLTISTMATSTYEQILLDIPGVEIIFGLDEEEMIRQVADGEADATAVDTVLALIYMPQHGGLHMTLSLSEAQGYGFAVRNGSSLAQELSDHLYQLKKSEIYYRLLRKYLGQQAVDMVLAAKE